MKVDVKVESTAPSGNEFIVSERSLPVDVPAEIIFNSLRDTRATGQLTFHLIEGGVRSVMLTQKRKVSVAREIKPR